MYCPFVCTSRAGHTLYVGDLEREDAVKYLIQKQPTLNSAESQADISIETASQVYEVLGGRIQHLKTFKTHYYCGYSSEKALNVLKSREREKFNRESDIPKFWKAVSIIQRNPVESLPLTEMLRHVPKETIIDLVDCDILMFERSPIGTLVKFQSPLTKHTVLQMDAEYNETMQRLKSVAFWEKLARVIPYRKIISLLPLQLW